MGYCTEANKSQPTTVDGLTNCEETVCDNLRRQIDDTARTARSTTVVPSLGTANRASQMRPRKPCYTIGRIVAANSVAPNPTSPIKMLIGVTKRRPSPSVMPLILQMTQKPLSFIQAIGFDPQPIASAK